MLSRLRKAEGCHRKRNLNVVQTTHSSTKSRTGSGLLVALGAFLLVLAIIAAPALAAEPPSINGELTEEDVHATRAVIVAVMHPGGLGMEWRAEYSTNPGSGPWIAAGSGEVPELNQNGNHPVFERVALGSGGPGAPAEARVLQHLTPNTTYYARFHAKTTDGEAEQTFKFTTTSVGEPEIFLGSTFETDSRLFVAGRFTAGPVNSTSALADTPIESNGADTSYHIEYSTSKTGPWSPFTVGASGTVTVAEDYANVEAKLTGLAPEKSYFARIIVKNSAGVVEEVVPFTTLTAKPQVQNTEVHNVTAKSAQLVSGVIPHGSATSWRFESASSAVGPWTPILGAAGAISQAEAEALPAEGDVIPVAAGFTGLTPGTSYYVRLFAENVAGEEGQNQFGESILSEDRGFGSFATSGLPSVTTFAVHALHGEGVHVLGDVNPDSTPTSDEQTITIVGAPTGGTFTLGFDGESTGPISYDAPADDPREGSVQHALGSLPSSPDVTVTGPDGGPYTVYFYGGDGGIKEPQITADASGLTPASTVSVVTAQAGGESYDTHYHFEYESQRQFEAGGDKTLADPVSTPEVDVGSGDVPEVVGQDLSGLAPGETYYYRIAAVSTLPGDHPVAQGEAHSLTVPAPAPVEAPVACENEALRTGSSSALPDCRAYEQVTPVDKEGAQELFTSGVSAGAGVVVGEDGEHVAIEAPGVTWGAGPDAGQGPYSFSRTTGGWRMTAGSPQPQTGVDRIDPQLFSPELDQFGFSSETHTSTGSGESKEIEFEAGPPGGPYVTVASIPHAEASGHEGWVGASADFSKLVLEVGDHLLLGGPRHPTGTKSGADLYEYSAGELRQANVDSAGQTIGTCGAEIVKGDEAYGYASSANAVSEDGSRVFFEAVPGSGCGEATNLYVRVGGGEPGAETIDLGAYHFLAADPQGTRVLLEKASSGAHEILLYEAGVGAGAWTVTPLFSTDEELSHGSGLAVSEDLSVIYFQSAEQLTPEAPPSQKLETGEEAGAGDNIYRYDVSTKTLSFIVQASPSSVTGMFSRLVVTPDGRYAYFEAAVVAGVPGGGVGPETDGGERHNTQLFRYDSAENVVECMSCASPSDPEPKLASVFGLSDPLEGRAETQDGSPNLTLVSADGDFAFFDTPAALVPSDVDGEVTPEPAAVGQGGALEDESASSDVYEWREDGIDGCAQIQGCLALITNGQGGGHNLLLGTGDEGHDVFFYTDSQLVPQDDDTAGDVYDARIGGGFPEPPHPVECEGVACSTPSSAPNDATPSSFTYQGPGNAVEASSVKAVVKAKKPKSKLKAKSKKKGKKKGKSKRKGKRATARRAGRAGGEQRAE